MKNRRTLTLIALLAVATLIPTYFWLTANTLPPPSTSPSAAELDFRKFTERFRDNLASSGDSVRVLQIHVSPTSPPTASFLLNVSRSTSGGPFPPTHSEANFYGEFSQTPAGAWTLTKAQSANIMNGTVSPMKDMPDDNVMQQMTAKSTP